MCGGGTAGRGAGGRCAGAPPAYATLSAHFDLLERAADESGNGDAAFHLQKAKMAMIAAHTSKRARQADLRGIDNKV